MRFRVLVYGVIVPFLVMQPGAGILTGAIAGETPSGPLTYDIVPAPEHYSASESDARFDLTGKIVVIFPESDSKEFTYAQGILKRVLADFDWTISKQAGGDDPGQILIGIHNAGTVIGRSGLTDNVNPPAGTESYAIKVTPRRIYLLANTSRGVLYAIQSFRQILSQAKEDGFIRALEIRDTPAYAFRAVCVGEGEYTSCVVPEQPGQKVEQRWTELAEFLDQLSAYKLNTLYYSQEWHFVYSEVPENMEMLRRLRDMCTERHIDVIPEFQGLGHASGHTHRYPHYAEANWYQDEPVTLTGNEPTPLKHPNVVLTKRTSITVKSKEERPYEEDTDYRVIPGVTAYRFSPKNEPYKVVRIPSGSIADGDTVLVSYDAVKEYNWDPGYCPMEREHLDEVERPRVHHYMREFRPEYISVCRDETRILGLDSRCLQSGKRPSELYAEDALRVVGYTQEIDPEVKVLIHYDMMQGGYTLAQGMDYAHLRSLIPKWVIPVVWVYKENDDGKREISAHTQGLLAQGYNIIAGPSRGSAVNIDLWRQQLGTLEGSSQPYKCLGYLFLGWTGTPFAWEAMSRAAWCNPPQN